MNFFEHQTQARRKTFQLIGGFVIALGAVVGFWAGLVWLVGQYYWKSVLPHLVVPSAVVLVMVIVAASVYRIWVLAQGGQVVARELGGQDLRDLPPDFYTVRLGNIVEEMAIASGLPIPQVFVLLQDEGVNAFAAGYSPNTAVIAVTKGAMTKLNRNELQGLVAHEFSHILNGDMRLNIVLVGTVFGLLFLSLMGGRLLQIFANTRNANNAAVVFPLVLIVLGSVGALAGRLIKSSVNRQREYLADASAVQFTRDPKAVAGALKKAAGLPSLSARHTEYSHLFFNSGYIKGWWNSLFASHPPILDRVQRLDPSFVEHSLLRAQRKWAIQPPNGYDEDLRLGFTDGSLSPSLLLSGFPHNSTAELYALIIGSQPPSFQHQARSYVASHVDRSVVQRLDQILEETPLSTGLEHAAKLRTALTHLRQNEGSWKTVENVVSALIHMGDHITLREYCVGQSVLLSIEEWRSPRSASRSNNTLSNARAAVVKLLNAVAFFGNSQHSEAEKAFAQGQKILFPHETIAYTPVFEGVASLRSIWSPLQHLRPQDKEKLLAAVVHMVCWDGIVQPNEDDLLAVLCLALGCPVPVLDCAR